MQRSLLALALALPLATPAFAQPPAQGTTHTFVDPVFTDTVFCDTFDEVLAIVSADEPTKVFQRYFGQRNGQNEPVCAAISATAVVTGVRPLGIMTRDDKRFDAWAVETRVGNATAYALYLEARVDVYV
jgi:hypothetical protein